MAEGSPMKAPSAKQAGKLLFRMYIVWSICADVILICGVAALVLGFLL